ncbi:MAG: rhodanese-like domain-containing protein [Bryobacteraceae bacterium]
MNRILLLVLLCAVLVFTWVALAQPSSQGVKKLTPEELKEMLASKQKVFLLDVREPHELDEMGAVEGYVNIPLGQLEGRLNEVPKDRTIVTICRVGGRAGRAAELLNRNGYQTGGATGVTQWKEKGYPVVYPKKNTK